MLALMDSDEETVNDSDVSVEDKKNQESEYNQLSPSERYSIFFTRTYESKNDIINAVVEYHRLCNRAFHLSKSDHRRYRAQCVEKSNCTFLINFAFSNAF